MAGELNKRLFYEKNIYETMTPGADIFSLPVARSLLSGASDWLNKRKAFSHLHNILYTVVQQYFQIL